MNKGQSLFEVLIAMGISALIITALVSLVSTAIRNANFSKSKTVASRYAQEAIEWMRQERDNDMEIFKTNSSQIKWCLQTLEWNNIGPCSENEVIPSTNFLREGGFSSSISSGKTIIEADVRVTWEDSLGLHEVISSTNFADWRER